jgi:hypothetical protein
MNAVMDGRFLKLTSHSCLVCDRQVMADFTHQFEVNASLFFGSANFNFPVSRLFRRHRHPVPCISKHIHRPIFSQWLGGSFDRLSATALRPMRTIFRPESLVAGFVRAVEGSDQELTSTSSEHLLNRFDFILGDVDNRETAARVEVVGDFLIGGQGADFRQGFDIDFADQAVKLR